MITEDFKKLLSSVCGLSHHQRNLVKAALDRQTDPPEVLRLIEDSFELKLACLHGAVCDCHVTAPLAVRNATVATAAGKPLMP